MSAACGTTSAPLVATLAERSITSVLIVCSIAGLFAPRGYNPLPVAALVDLAVVLTVLLTGVVPSRGAGFPFFIATSYLAIKTTLMQLSGGTKLFDYIQAYKAFIFLLPVCLLAGKEVVRPHVLSRTFKMILPFFLIKYAAALYFGITTIYGARPGLLDENNFEMAMVIGLAFLVYQSLGPRRTLWLAAVALTTLLSESRSAVIEFAILLAFIFLRGGVRRLPIAFTSVAVGVAGVYYVFSEREIAGGGLQTIDRYRFYRIFTQEMSHRPAWEWFSGSFPLTPLSPTSCQQLQYYSKLFSDPGTGKCYSVVLHAYLFRIVLDHGMLGAIILVAVLWKAMRVGCLTRRETWFIFLLGLANGLSVSSFNSEYMMLVVVFAITRRSRPGHAAPHAIRDVVDRKATSRSTGGTAPSRKLPRRHDSGALLPEETSTPPRLYSFRDP